MLLLFASILVSNCWQLCCCCRFVIFGVLTLFGPFREHNPRTISTIIRRKVKMSIVFAMRSTLYTNREQTVGVWRTLCCSCRLLFSFYLSLAVSLFTSMVSLPLVGDFVVYLSSALLSDWNGIDHFQDTWMCVCVCMRVHNNPYDFISLLTFLEYFPLSILRILTHTHNSTWKLTPTSASDINYLWFNCPIVVCILFYFIFVVVMWKFFFLPSIMISCFTADLP